MRALRLGKRPADAVALRTQPAALLQRGVLVREGEHAVIFRELPVVFRELRPVRGRLFRPRTEALLQLLHGVLHCGDAFIECLSAFEASLLPRDGAGMLRGSGFRRCEKLSRLLSADRRLQSRQAGGAVLDLLPRRFRSGAKLPGVAARSLRIGPGPLRSSLRSLELLLRRRAGSQTRGLRMDGRAADRAGLSVCQRPGQNAGLLAEKGAVFRLEFPPGLLRRRLRGEKRRLRPSEPDFEGVPLRHEAHELRELRRLCLGLLPLPEKPLPFHARVLETAAFPGQRGELRPPRGELRSVPLFRAFLRPQLQTEGACLGAPGLTGVIGGKRRLQRRRSGGKTLLLRLTRPRLFQRLRQRRQQRRRPFPSGNSLRQRVSDFFQLLRPAKLSVKLGKAGLKRGKLLIRPCKVRPVRSQDGLDLLHRFRQRQKACPDLFELLRPRVVVLPSDAREVLGNAATELVAPA